MGLRKFWLDLEISEARFLMGLEVSFLGDSYVSKYRFFFSLTGFWSLEYNVFSFRLVFRESNFSEFVETAYRTELLD